MYPIQVHGSHTFDKYKNQLENVKALEFTFTIPPLLNTSNHDLLIKKWLDSSAPIETLKVSYSDELKILPTQPKATVKKLIIRKCPKLTDFNTILQRFPLLEELVINDCSVDFGQGILFAPNLKKLEIDGDRVNTLKGISNCKQLESLRLTRCNLEFLPEEISEMSQLQNLLLLQLPNLKQLPSLKNCSQLNQLILNELKSISDLDIDFSVLPALETLTLSYFKNESTPFKFPKSISNCKNITRLNIINCDFTELPESLSQLTKLEDLCLRMLSIEVLPDIFAEMTALQKVVIYACPNIKSIPPSFGELTQLTSLEIAMSDSLEKFECGFSQLQNLRSVRFNDLKKLTAIPTDLGKCAHLDSLELSWLPSLNELPKDMFEATNLTRLNLIHLPVSSIPDTILQNKKLTWLSIKELPNLQYFPKGLGKIDSLSHIGIEGVNKQIFQPININGYYDEFWKSDITTRSHIFDWVFFKEKAIPVPIEVGSDILKVMGFSNVKKISDFLNINLSFLNPTGKPIDSSSISEGGKIFISGRLIGGKADAKNKLEGLGLKVVSKLTDDVAFVLLGKKPKYVEGLFNGKRIYFSQTELEGLKKEINPGMLQTKDTPPHFVENLNELILSPDTDNTRVALELVQNHGLPTELEEAFLVLAHTLSKGKLKNDVRRFLRGKISDKKEKILDAKTYPFAPHKAHEFLTNEEATRLYYFEYKKTGKLRPQFFQFNEGNHPYRKEYFEKILPTMTKNPKRLNIEAVFTVEELNVLFNLPHLQGQLKELILFYPKSGGRIDSLIQHKASLKKLHLAMHWVEEKFPTSIYELENLTGLRMGIKHLTAVPSGIGNLTKLKKLVINNSYGENLELPDDLLQLKKLTSIYLTPTINIEKFEGKLPPNNGSVKI